MANKLQMVSFISRLYYSLPDIGIWHKSSSFKDMAQAYADPSLFQKAITEANKNNEVLQTLGTIEPLDDMAILEGNTRYSNNNKAMEATVRVTGKKAKGKMDISAQKIGSEWNYEIIKIRVHETKQEIIIKK